MDYIHESWSPLFDKYDISKLLDEIYNNENSSNENIFPTRINVLRIFEMSVFDISLVLLGQDPYHSPGQAHGFSFSVPYTEKKIPPFQKPF